MLQTRRPALSGNALKGIAILAMTLDHLTWTLWPGYSTDWWVLVCHLLGRVTAPIMWFFIVRGLPLHARCEKVRCAPVRARVRLALCV